MKMSIPRTAASQPMKRFLHDKLPRLVEALGSQLNIGETEALIDALYRDLLRRQGKPWRDKLAIEPEESQHIRALRLEGKTAKEIGAIVGRTAPAVQQHIGVAHPDLVNDTARIRGAYGATVQGKTVRHPAVNASLAREHKADSLKGGES